MPLLDPSSQYQLITEVNNAHSEHAIRFYLRYLRIASRNIYRNFPTIDTSLQFKNDLADSIQLIHDQFGCELSQDDFKKPIITDFYNYLYRKIQKVKKKVNQKSSSLQGNYFMIYNKYETRYFQPNVISFNDNQHSWFFTDTNIAILAMNNISDDYNIYRLLKLEIDLMAAAGFILVLCTRYSKNNHFNSFLFDSINRNQFTEIHLNIINDNEVAAFLEESNKYSVSQLEPYKGFLYIYSHYISKKHVDQRSIYKEIKKMHRIRIINFAKGIDVSIKKPLVKNIRPFAYYKDGFNRKNLRVFLSNVPLYNERKDDLTDLIPSDTSDLSFCYLSTDDFLNWKNELIEILINDKCNHYRKRYIRFEDLHTINKHMFVTDMLSLGGIKPKNIDKVDEIENNIKKILKERKNKKSFKKKIFFSLIQENLIRKNIEYVSYAYSYFSNSVNNDFSIHRPQIYTALMASKKLLSKKNLEKKKLEDEKDEIDRYLKIDLKQYYRKLDKTDPFLNKFGDFLAQKLEKMSPEKQAIFYQMIRNKPKNYVEEVLLRSKNDEDNDDEDKIDFLETLVASSKEKYDEKLLKRKAAIQEKLNKYKSKCHKGYIYQVETGEGKSCIIAMIAAILALNGRTVHITSSNINLANRDYVNSFEFFKLLKLKSAVFLHDNELPIPRKMYKANQNGNSSSSVKIQSKANDNDDKKDEKDDTEIDYFKNNYKGYYDYHKRKNTEFAKFFSNKNYYGPEQFKNSSRMNYGVCGLDSNNRITSNRPDVIFSTFVNFECFYLKMMELCPAYIPDYFKNSVLLIDEADSILIDEISNGTIVSREMKSNTKEVLQYVYDNKDNFSAKKMYESIINLWPKCNKELTEKDVVKMYSEIDLVNKNEEFQNGRKYIINEYEVKNNKKKKRLINQALNVTKEIVLEVGKGLRKIFGPDEKDETDDDEENEDDGNDDDNDDDDDDEDEDEDDEDDEEEDEEEEDDDDDSPVTVFREIVPFDYDHKGISEPCKEFGGFIQQFIAIKESRKEENKNMIIKDMSMSYLYVSHPIFVKLYGSVCGFTGTLGNKKDKQIYKEHYDLETMKIPRNQANYRVEFPIILCDTITERNKKIVQEVVEFHKRGNPVLVIFQDLKEIETVSEDLNAVGIKYINIFNGKNDDISPDFIAGKRGAVSLGTNVCGRGTNIVAKKDPLHVIISYYTSNVRVMDQARGRTARQGRKGTTRIICLKDQYLYPTKYDGYGIKSAIGEFEVKRDVLSDFIDYFMFHKPWIFSTETDKQEITKDQIEKMKEARINVNRIVAFNYEFPLKMRIKTFLKIQAQKIFSLMNCPNSEYSWKLFQRYVREMVLESWSIKIDEFDEDFFNRDENKEYKERLDELKDILLKGKSEEYQENLLKINKEFEKNIIKYKDELQKNKIELISNIEKYLPVKINEMVPAFMFIFEKVISKYQNKVLGSFKYMDRAFIQLKGNGYISLQTGFKPYSLLSDSGARINYKNYTKTNFISDPELKYMKKMPNNRICLLSITEKIDDLFNLIFKHINKVVGSNTFLRFYLRRGLFGCEFGLCLDLPAINEGFNDPHCLIDKDPLIMFTLTVKSMAPVLAGILIIYLVYAASLAKDISEWMLAFPEKFTKEAIKRAAILLASETMKKLVQFSLDKMIKCLKKVLKKQLNKLKENKSNLAKVSVVIIESLMHVFSSSIGEKINKKISDVIGDKIKITINWKKKIKDCFDIERLMKISFLLLLCFATFILNFQTARKDAIKNKKKDTAKNEKKDPTKDKQKDSSKNEKNDPAEDKKKEPAKSQKKDDAKAEDDESVKHEKEDSKEFEKAFKKREGLKIVNEKDKKKFKKTLKSLKNKNKNLLNDKEKLKDEFDDKAFSDDEDNEFDNLSKDDKKQKEEEIKNKMNDINNKFENSYTYKFLSCEPLKQVEKATSFIEDKMEKAEKISNGVATLKTVVNKKIDKKFIQMTYKGLKKPFIQQLTMYATNVFPSILNAVGYRIHKKKQSLIVEKKENGSLESYIKRQNHITIQPTQKLIIAYGVARAMEFLHSHNIVHRNLKPVNIMLDSKFYPFLSEFYLAKQTETKVPYFLQEMTPGFMPPEFYNDCKSNQNSPKIDVYSYGVTLYILITETDPFENLSKALIIKNAQNGILPPFPDGIDEKWKMLIEKCWNKDPEVRPTFKQIRKKFESEFITDQSIAIKVFKDYKNLFKSHS